MDRAFGVLGAAYGLTGVAVGAFTAHLLGERLSAQALQWIETGARYQLVHALALLLTAIVVESESPRPAARGAGWAFAAGVPLFAGSLYLMAFGLPRWLGAVTPLGGACFLVGWSLLAWHACRRT